MADQDENVKVVARNRKARHNYFIEETYEAGIKLKGTEIKSIREGRVNLKDSFALVEEGEVYLHNMHISPYKQGNRANHEPERKRKLLLHKKQIRSLLGATHQKGFTLIPLKLYLKGNLAKIELALAKGKEKHDKREEIKKREHQREMERALKDKNYRR
ncbi:SsrA-binding protein SmpB [Halarsenatibacter silvermanii]|uniref:SsrA-binding protein n=1 Tax=Halarsenatibacter silvermanii TaxID=321763 RepID=A0A1G9RN62_9FIRM|nr:SsrA-binding protein SmpB [Halarsenatibacter silvermanii]SDM24708.1 SsrA-binding protein [Halarsenatibacter silvermanii]